MTSFQTVNKKGNCNNSSNHKSNQKNNLQAILTNCESYMLTNMNLLKCIQENERLTDYTDVYKKKL